MNKGFVGTESLPISLRLKTHLLTLAVACVLAMVGVYFDRLAVRMHETELRDQVLKRMSVVRARLEAEIFKNAHLVNGLVAAITVEPSMSRERFEAFARPVFSHSSALRNIGAAPDLVLRHIYPLKGNESALNLDYRTRPAQLEVAQRALESLHPALYGPVRLVEGGQGLIAMLPVPATTPGAPPWGVVSAVIDTARLYEAAGLTSEPELDIAIRHVDTSEVPGPAFYGRDSLFASQAVTVRIALPSVTWNMASAPRAGWREPQEQAMQRRLILLLLALTIILPVSMALNYAITRREREAVLQGLFDLSPIGIALNDIETGKFLELNAAFAYPTGYSEEELLERTYWDLTPVQYSEEEQFQLNQLHTLGRYGPYEKEYMRKDGTRYPVRLSGIRLTRTNGRRYIWSLVEDISQRREAERIILQGKQRLDLVIEATSVGIWDWQVQTGETEFNERWAEIVGYTLEELGPISIDTWIRLTHPEDLEQSRAQLERYWRGECDHYVCEARMRHKRGHWVWVLDTGKTVETLPDGRPKRMVGTHLDITDRKLFEQQLQVSRDQFASLVSNIPGVTYRCALDAVWTMHFMSGQVATLTGYPVSDFIGNKVRTFASIIHADDVEMVDNTVNHAIQRDTAWDVEYRIIHRDGTLRWVHERGNAVTDDRGRVQYLDGFILDITEKQHNAERLNRQQQLLESMSHLGRIGAWEVDLDAGRVYWSPMTCELHDVPHGTVPSIEEAIHYYREGVSRDLMQRCVENAIQRGIPYAVEVELVTATGRHIWCAAAGQAEFRDGKCVRLYGSFQDIDRRKRTEQELIWAKEAAESATRAKGEFLATMSHEIRTPMNGVLGMLNLLQRSSLNHDQQRKIAMARTSAESLLTLLNDVLDFSKVDAGKLDLEVLDFNLFKLMDDITESFALKAAEKSIELILDVTQVEHPWIKGDPSRLRQIFTNLVGNAIKFTDQGEITLRVSLKQSNDLVVLSGAVIDTGIGIAPEKLPHLFSAFTQGDTSTTRQFGGTGLGLAICKRLCELMQGSIRASSELGTGSRFQFMVVLAPSDRQPGTQDLPPRGSPKLLLVERNAAQRQQLKLQWEQWGATVIDAPGGHSACMLAERHMQSSPESTGFDAAVISRELADMTGVELIYRLRKMPPGAQLPCFLTLQANESVSDEQRIETGLRGAFDKPLKMADLRAVYSIASDVNEASVEPELPVIERVEWPENTHVLLVEDNPINQEVARLMLTDMGLTPDLATNGREALEHMLNSPAQHPYTLLLMDCQMPLLDGYETTRQIRQGIAGDRYKDVLIIAMTANALKGDREKCLRVGMNDYLSKPIDTGTLTRKLKQWLVSRDKSAAPGTSASVDELPETDTGLIVWDQSQAYESLSILKDKIPALIRVFLDSLPARMAELQATLQKGDLVKLRFAAHALKGSAAQLRCMEVQTLAQRLENTAHAGDGAGCVSLVEALTLAAGTLSGVLSAHLEEITPS